MQRSDFPERLGEGPPVLLDGPLGTELERRGVDTTLPLWSAWGLVRAPEVVAAIHGAYVAAGAEVVTTNTFRTHRRSLDKAGLGERAGELTRLAVRLARTAATAAERPTWVAGSIAPLEDCYRPDLTPVDGDLRDEHAEIAARLADGNVDLLLVETMPTVREAVAATRAATATGLPVVTGLVCDLEGRLLSGESVDAAVAALTPLGPAALVINCTPAHRLHVALDRLAAATTLPVGGYGNVGHADDEQGWTRTDALGPGQYLEFARRWLAAGARLVGGCCGTTPAHTAALRRELDRGLRGADQARV